MYWLILTRANTSTNALPIVSKLHIHYTYITLTFLLHSTNTHTRHTEKKFWSIQNDFRVCGEGPAIPVFAQCNNVPLTVYLFFN